MIERLRHLLVLHSFPRVLYHLFDLVALVDVHSATSAFGLQLRWVLGLHLRFKD